MSARRPAARIREVTSVDDPALRAAYRLVQREFDPAETVPLREWRASLRELADQLWTDVAWHLLVAEHHGEVVGAVSGNYLGNVNVGVIGYLVVAPHGRGLRLGPRLRASLRRRFDRDARRVRGEPVAALVGEVDAANPWLATLARRRGVLPLDFPYYHPKLHPGHELNRYVFYYQSLGTPRRSLGASELRRLLYTLWRRVYRIPRPREREAFRRMMRALRGRRLIGRYRMPPRAGRKANAA
ncbi:MAG: GNAT family N-acetyltransferase [Gemmatimonadales bacterium]